MKVLVLCGGDSSEREVSKRSGAATASALKAAGYEVMVADPAESDFRLSNLAKEVDCVFPILHGQGGEDGSIQEDLERLQVPFLGSGSRASKDTFDKFRYKQILNNESIPNPRGELVDYKQFLISPLSKLPYVLKPVDGGSSIDTFIVRTPLSAKWNKTVFGRHQKMLLEELVEGQEVTIGVLGDKALPIILIRPPEGEEFNYENKYNGATQEIVVSDEIPTAVQDEAKNLAVKVHQLFNCRHISRTDMIVTPSGDLKVLETNTIPGLTDQSLFPKSALAAGMNMAQLMDILARSVVSDNFAYY